MRMKDHLNDDSDSECSSDEYCDPRAECEGRGRLHLAYLLHAANLVVGNKSPVDVDAEEKRYTEAAAKKKKRNIPNTCSSRRNLDFHAPSTSKITKTGNQEQNLVRMIEKRNQENNVIMKNPIVMRNPSQENPRQEIIVTQNSLQENPHRQENIYALRNPIQENIHVMRNYPLQENPHVQENIYAPRNPIQENIHVMRNYPLQENPPHEENGNFFVDRAIIAGARDDGVLFVEKKLNKTDNSDGHHRFSISMNKVINDKFLTKREKTILRKTNYGLKATLIDPIGREYDVALKIERTGKNCDCYKIPKPWNQIRKNNGIQTGTVIQLWASRPNGDDLCFKLVLIKNEQQFN
ncbi:hypothetical protein ACP275_01G106200 [Erythranthe tilingii]